MNRSDLQQLAEMRALDAKVLLDAGNYPGYYYIAGYTVECALKACIAKQVQQYDFPDKKIVTDSYTHDLRALLRVARLEDELKSSQQQIAGLAANWEIVRDWTESSRYDANIPELTARDLYTAISDTNSGVLAWLKKYW